MSLASISVMYMYAWLTAGEIVSLSLLSIFLHWQLVAAHDKKEPPHLGFTA